MSKVIFTLSNDAIIRNEPCDLVGLEETPDGSVYLKFKVTGEVFEDLLRKWDPNHTVRTLKFYFEDFGVEYSRGFEFIADQPDGCTWRLLPK